MPVEWLKLPGEIRTNVYCHHFRSFLITLHANRETWHSTDSESEEEPEPHLKGPGIDLAYIKKAEKKRSWLSILLTCKTVHQEAKPEFFNKAFFLIEYGEGHPIHRDGFEISPRIKHLEIELALPDLWEGTNDFLKRHFRAGRVRMRELSFTCQAVEREDVEYGLKQILQHALPRVDKVSFNLEVYIHVGDKPKWDNLPVEECAVEIYRPDRVCIKASKKEYFERAKYLLRRTRRVPKDDEGFRWVKSDSQAVMLFDDS